MYLWFIPFTLFNYLSSITPTDSYVLPTYEKSNTTITNNEALLRFEKLANDHNLHNPCSPGRYEEDNRALIEDDITYTDLIGTPGNKIGLGLLRELITKSTFLQGLAINIIRMNLIDECTTLRLPNVAYHQTYDQLKKQSMVQSLSSLYLSLTNQTAHVFYIWDKQKTYLSHNCSSHTPLNVPPSHHNPKNHSKLLSQHYWTIGVNLRDLMCLFVQTANAFNIDLNAKQSTDRVLAHSVTDTPICSRKAVLDCQVLKTSIVLLENMSDYLRDQTVDIVTSMVNSS